MRASRRQSASPRPAPGEAGALTTAPVVPLRRPGSKIASRSSSGTPGPSSWTVKRTLSPSGSIVIWIQWRAWRAALSTSGARIRSSSCGSTATFTGRRWRSHLCLERFSVDRGDRRLCAGARVAGRPPRVELRAGGRHQRVECAAELPGALEDVLERRSGLVGLPAVTERVLRLGDDAGERRAQLVRDLGREALLVAQARGQPLEQPVEGAGKLRELVPRRPEREAAVEVVLAPVGGLPGHARHGAQRPVDQPPGR